MTVLHEVWGGPDRVRLVLSGEIDVSVRDDLRGVLHDVVATAAGATDLDLHDVTFLDCAGVGEFIRAYNEAQRLGHTVTVSGAQGVVRRVLELTDVLALLTGHVAVSADR